MKRLFSILVASLVALSSLTLIGCGKKEETTEGTVLRVCNCEDYIDETLLEEFTKETGIEVIYSTYGTNENLYNELVINPNSYDLVVPSEYMIQKLAEEGRIQKLDLSKIPNYRPSPFIQDRLEELKLNEYMVGYMWGTMGWVYNTDKVSEQDVSSWRGPFENESLKGKITIKDAVRDSYLVGLAMAYEEELKLTNDTDKIAEILNRTTQRDIDKVGETLSALKPMLYGFEVDSGKNDIILGNIDAYVAWSGDAAYAIDVASGDAEDEDGTILEGDDVRNLSYYIPDEGSNIWFDGLVMPSASTNHDAVYKFLDFISRPENVARNMNYTGYTSMIAGDYIFENVVLDWFDESEDLAEDEGINVDLSYFFGEGDYTVKVSEEGYGRLMAQYPIYEIVQRCAVMNNFSSDTLLSINDMWESVKGETFPLWIILLVVGLVILLAVFIVLYRNKDKISWFKLPEKKATGLEKKGYKVIKKEDVI